MQTHLFDMDRVTADFRSMQAKREAAAMNAMPRPLQNILGPLAAQGWLLEAESIDHGFRLTITRA